ncbi:predicted protein [Streptomyces sp. C]|nr:predicted protein [Streptomyces sp. C]
MRTLARRIHTHRALRIITIRTSTSIEFRQHEGRMPRTAGGTRRPAGRASRPPGRLSAPARPHTAQTACPRSRGRNGQVAPVLSVLGHSRPDRAPARGGGWK